jgi:hypothetical protein
MERNGKLNKGQHTTMYIKHLAVSALSSISARIKSSCNLTGKCFEMPNVSYTNRWVQGKETALHIKN